MSVFINTSCFLLNQLSATATVLVFSLMGSVLYFVDGVFMVYDSWHYWSQVRVSSVVDWYATAPLSGCAESDCCRHPPCSARVALVLDGHSSLSDCYTQRFCMIWWVCRYIYLNCYALAFHSDINDSELLIHLALDVAVLTASFDRHLSLRSWKAYSQIAVHLHNFPFARLNHSSWKKITLVAKQRSM